MGMLLQDHEKKVMPSPVEDLDKAHLLRKVDAQDAEALPVTPQKMERTSTSEQISPQGRRSCPKTDSHSYNA